jgi:hypothetical protein
VIERDRLEEDRDGSVTTAAARQLRSIGAASCARDGTAMTRPGMSRSALTALSLWKWPPNPFWQASPATRTTMGLRYCPAEKNCMLAASPRSWSSALCR